MIGLFRHPTRYLFTGPMWRRRLAAWWLPRWYERCDHDWHYDTEESAGPWTGYIERCDKCGALQQVPQ